jgi:hypothetical protein
MPFTDRVAVSTRCGIGRMTQSSRKCHTAAAIDSDPAFGDSHRPQFPLQALPDPPPDLDEMTPAQLRELVVLLLTKMAELEQTVVELREELARLKGLKDHLRLNRLRHPIRREQADRGVDVDEVGADVAELLFDPDNLAGKFGSLVDQCCDDVTFRHGILPISVRSGELSDPDWRLVSPSGGVFAP